VGGHRMKRFALAFVAAVAGLGLACRGGETRPAADPAAESKPAEARPAGDARDGEPAAPAAASRPARRPAPSRRVSSSAPAEPSARSTEAARAAEPARRAEPEPVVVPDDTPLALTLDTAVSSDKSRPEDLVVARLARSVLSDGRTVLPAGSEVRGRVLVAQRSGKVKGLARLAVSFDRIEVKGRTYRIEASPIDVTAEKTKGRDAKVIGGAAALGAIVGGIADGGGGAAKGGLLGGAAGTGAVLLTRGNEVELPAGSSHTVRLRRSLTLD